MNAVTTFPTVPFAEMERMAHAVVASGLFGMKKQDEALALMLIAQAEGMHPAKAIQEYHIIQGRPALKADAMLSRFQMSGGRVKWLNLTDSDVTAEFTHELGGTAKISWTFEQAKKAGLTGKDNWAKYPRAMLRSRVISEGVRTVFPACNQGFYTPEEVQDFDTKPDMKNMGAAEVVNDTLPLMNNDAFDKNFPTWKNTIESGKRTPTEIIGLIKTKWSLTDKQEKDILNINVAATQDQQ